MQNLAENQQKLAAKMKTLLVVLLFFHLSSANLNNLSKTRELKDDGRLNLHYDVKNEMFLFRIEVKDANSNTQIGLAFSLEVSMIQHTNVKADGYNHHFSGQTPGWVPRPGGPPRHRSAPG